MSLIFCRHGQTQFNLEDKFQGVSDSPLTELGKEESKKINEYLKQNFKVQKFYISPATRVRSTYEILSEGIDAEMQVIPELREVCYGDWEEKVRSSIDPEVLKIREENRFTYVHPGTYGYLKGESYNQVFERLKPFLENIQNSQEDICIIAHNGVLLSVIKFFKNLTEDEAEKVRVGNNEILVVDRVGDKFNLERITI